MAPRRGLIVVVLLAGTSLATATACRGGSGSIGGPPSLDEARPPSGNVVSGSSGVAGSSSSSSGMPGDVPGANPNCPRARAASTSVEELDEAVLRESLPGIYGGCNMPSNLELRIDDATERILWWSLDERMARTGTGGWIEVGSCSGDTCQIIQHSDPDAAPGSQGQNEQLTLWTDPVAIKMTYAEWVRLAE